LGPLLQRALAGEAVVGARVSGQLGAASGGVRHFRDCLQIRHYHYGVCRRLNKQHFGVVLNCRFDVGRIRRIDEIKLNPVISQDALEQAIGSAVGIIRNDYMFTGFY